MSPGVGARVVRASTVMASNRGARGRAPVDSIGLSVVSVGGYSDTVSGRTMCAPCKADWPSMALMLSSVARRLSTTVRPLTGCQRVDTEVHACGQLQYGLANQGLIFSLVLLYYFILGGYVYNCAQWKRRTPPA